MAKNDIVFIYGGNLIGFEFIILAGKLLGKKVIFRSTMLNEDDAETLIEKRIGGLARKQILKTVSVYYSLNVEFTARWLKYFLDRDKIFESVQGVNTKKFNLVSSVEKLILKQKLNLPVDKPIIISIGYLIKRKGFDIAYRVLREIREPFHYLIIGDHEIPANHYMSRFNEEMNELHKLGLKELAGQISFKGPKEDVSEYLKASDIFILFSRREGFPPNVLMEAMACGLPCVVRDIKGVKNTMENKNKIYLSDNKNEGLKRIINKLLKEPDSRSQLGHSAYEDIHTRGTFKIIWNRLKEKL